MMPETTIHPRIGLARIAAPGYLGPRSAERAAVAVKEDVMDALALVEAVDHVCARYRIHAFKPALAGMGARLHVEALARNPLARLGQLATRPRRFDSVLLQRKLLPGPALEVLRRSSRRLVFDMDDAILYRDSYDPRGPNDPRRARRFARTVQACDAVLAGNAFLARCAIDAGADPLRVHIIPTCIDLDDYPARPSRAADRSVLDLVWIGSSSTLQGLEARRDLLERIGREVPSARLRVIADRAPRFDHLPVVAVAWSRETEAAELARGDVGVSWVPDDLWTRGKCGLKLLQYRASSLASIADPVGVHPEMVRDGRDGFLPRSDDQWVEAVRSLARDPELRSRLGEAARADVTTRYAVTAWSETFAKRLMGRTLARVPHVPRPHGVRAATQSA
jgi:glycosyltransferase involved in cell wall biosynthesis